ncbi:S-layer homology domain-containing protein [Paenibacillus harenae]|uniref:Spore germination protein YaaH n=1 Tax=Paenibacillus harenae TaxID=306543 RepID=A0ABT9U4Z1_PAEHA|nr:S-layer homology domain-containing protein [Paenibacillus harenae]MDQ0113334.1 spore germination protein YaaH [Paenibacillus harenae]
MNRFLGKIVTATIAGILAASLLPQAASADKGQPFDDISKSYARNEIIDLYNKKILAGTSATTFSPAKSITRAEFITVLGRLLKLEPVASPITPYTDVAKSAWYYGSIQAAVQLELVSGTSATTFAPAKAVTRQEAAVMIANAFNQTGSRADSHLTYEDKGKIAGWAIDAVAIVNELGLMKGDTSGSFRPLSPITRQETAVLLAHVLERDGWAAELAAKPDERIVLGWQYGQTTTEYQSHILRSNVNTLSPRWYFVGSTGAVDDTTDTKLAAWAKSNGKKIWAMVGNRSDQEATHQLLSSTSARTAAVNGLAARVSQYGLDGLNIDFENVAPADRANFTALVSQLAVKLHALGKMLSVDVSPDLGTDWTEAFDYAALGKQADYMVLMGYDEHYGGSLYPGPNASLPYDEQAVNTILKVVASNKIILALPFYNRDWSLNPNGTVLSSAFVSLTEQNQTIASYGLKPVWSPDLGQYVASYSKQAIKHTIWIEDGRSVIAKYQLAVKSKLAGVAYWYIGGESPDLWASLRNAEKYYDYSFR